jgi:hypothetical protein
MNNKTKKLLKTFSNKSFFKVAITRTQIQTQVFHVEASSRTDLKKTLEELDFDHIDERFDEAEVQCIDYEVGNINKIDKPFSKSFADEDLQLMLNDCDNV